MDIKSTIRENIELKEKLITEKIADIELCGNKLADALAKGGKILFCGNGGSAADSQHIAAELVVRLRGDVNRKALRAISLTVDSSILTAGSNDFGFKNVFARQVEAYGDKGDVLVGISTSGSSANVLKAAQKAKELGLTTIGLLGKDGGDILNSCDFSVVVPSEKTARIQETHILIGHIWCEMIEEKLFPELLK